ncbi:hypothetical protein BGX23_005510 [Mortierella sp. AD031]|nr:hypothetical protein BGX23_005510 [Mortierella sp. AD031]
MMETPIPSNFILPPPGDSDGPGSVFFLQLLNHYQPSPTPPTAQAQDPSSDCHAFTSDSTKTDNTHTHTTFRQYYQLNYEFYKPGGPTIL